MNQEELPKFESRKQYLTRKYRDMWNIDKFDRPRFWKSKRYCKMRDRILHHYIGKSFDEAFSYYCSKVPQRFQYLFLKEFEEPFSRWNEWSLDENKNIVYTKRESYISQSEWREILRQREENDVKT